ncbi:hypothetical protein K437DRAFT_254982 [Tilletiaria anomala UBC 951]|uniref:SYO1-like TPR repeats domain-containing protein n=1 Tax=Tilletiaria anomala (strain ATCC 24038 / CBS 436.72 / UBC 951) TaxID=1037660 RepID=A0A066WAQ9_TILAU|nr:uncharacterized protein K437DRAFT_254982 [Tilletiaria anomala UBC 951]KDN50811.1 hypothetical protein K437DRAFT_254982 [Tilletiaria anomala UBC 951]
MPKSGFRAAARRVGKQRHNPLARPKLAAVASSNASSSSSSTASLAQQLAIEAGIFPPYADGSSGNVSLVHILSKLPLETGKGKASTASAAPNIAVSDTIWALASISLLSSSRSSRKALLAPSHKLVARILHALHAAGVDQQEGLETKREAAGALRNLCIEAGYDDVRHEIARQGGIESLLEQIGVVHALIQQRIEGSGAKSTPEALGQQMEQERQKLEAALPTADKPLEKMNRKEKRHAAKAASILDKQQQPPSSTTDRGATTPLSTSSMSAGLNSKLAAIARGALSSDDEFEQLLYELQDNLLTIIWCLAEAAEDLVIALSRHAAPLARTLSTYVRYASSKAAAVEETSSSSSPGSADRRSASLKALLRQLGVSAANALCVLSDDNPAFARVLAGVQPSSLELRALNKAAKQPSSGPPGHVASGDSHSLAAGAGKKRMQKLQLTLLTDIDVDAGMRDVSAITSAVVKGLSKTNAFPSPLASPTSATGDKADIDMAMMTMLCAAVLRNISASLPPESRSRVILASNGAWNDAATNSSEEQRISLPAFEAQHILPRLVELLSSINQGELCSEIARAALATKEQQQQQKQQSASSVDMLGVMQTNSEQQEAVAQADEAETDAVSSARKRADDCLHIILLALEILAEVLPALAVLGEGSNVSIEETEWQEDGENNEDSIDADMEELVGEDTEMIMDEEKTDEDTKVNGAHTATARTRMTSSQASFAASALAQAFSHAALVPQLLRLSTAEDLALAYPSVTSSKAASPEEQAAREAGAAALRQVHLRSISVLSNLLLGLAANSPPPPSQPLLEGAGTPARIAAFVEWSTSDVVKARFEELWQVLFSIASKTADVPAVSSSNCSVYAEGQDGRALVEQCVGSMWAIARSLQGDLPLSIAMSGIDIVTALQAAYLNAQSDPMRAKAIGTLGCLARSPSVSVETNRSIGNFLINVIKQLPADGKSVPGTTSPESMVAALNAIYDVYADENAAYDQPVFRQGQFSIVLRQCSSKVRSTTRAVDRRKFASLRQAADEAYDNLIAFVQYRDSLKL